MSKQREIAYTILCSSLKGEKYANLAMQKDLNILPFKQRPLVTELVNGVLRNFYYLEYQFKDSIKKDTRLELRIILAMAYYELYFLGEKAYAVVNEYVSLASEKEKSFINAILRRAQKQKFITSLDNKHLAIKHSLPLFIVNLLAKQYNSEDFLYILDDSLKAPKIFYHLSPLVQKEQLNELDVTFLSERVFVSEKNLINIPYFKKGLFYVQDYNASKIVDMLSLTKDSLFLDMCSSPGAKLFNALEIVMEENVYSNDVTPKRLALIKAKAQQLGFKKINYTCSDACLLSNKYKFKFNRILLDAPCSGLGVLKRKPDIRYRLKPENLDELQFLQQELLASAFNLLADDGILVYSTCTLNRKENDKQIAKFLKTFPQMVLVEEKLFLKEDGDHFYAAKLKKEVSNG